MEQLDEAVLIGSRTLQRELPASGVYLGGDDLQRSLSLDINRVLRLVPGVSLREEDGMGLLPNISIRGVTTERSKSVLLMEDGIPSAPAPYSAPSAYYSPDIARMSGLEVLKGSSQIRYGPSTTGGVINHLSTPVPDAMSTRVKLSYGSNREIVGHVHHGGTRELESGARLGYLVEGHVHRTGGFKRIESTRAYTGDSETGFIRSEPMVKLFWELPGEKEHRFDVKYGHTDLDADETYLGLSQEDFDLDPHRRYAASRLDNLGTANHRASIRHSMRPTGRIRLATTGYLQHFARNWAKLHQLGDPGLSLAEALLDTTPGGGLDVLKGLAPGTLRVRNNNREYRIHGVRTVATLDFETGRARHRWETGLRYHFDEVDRFQWNEDYRQDENGAFVEHDIGTMGAAGDRLQQSRALAFHTRDEIRLARWTFVPGVRMEWVDQRYEQDMRRHDGGGSPASGDGNLDILAGGASLACRITDRWNTFLGVHRGFALPGPRSSIRSGLEEETSLAFELGSRHSLSEHGLHAEAILFHTRFDNLIVGGNLGGGGSPETENVGRIDSTGLELALEYDPGRARDWAVRTPARLVLTLTDASLVGDATNTDPESLFEGGKDGSEVPYIPDYTLSVRLGLEYGRTSTHILMSHVPATFTSASNSTEPIRVDGTPDARIGKTDSHFVTDLILRHRLRDRTVLFGGVRNLFDREYVASRHPHGPRPGAPRLFHAGLETTF